MDTGAGGALCYPQSDCTWGTICFYADGSAACVDTDSDPFNCGQCNNECTVDEVCIVGLGCAATGTACPDVAPDPCTDSYGLDYCTDTTSDEMNCGSCGYECAIGCVDAQCI